MTTTVRQELQDVLERVVWRFRGMTAQDVKDATFIRSSTRWHPVR
ncbi:hypothetical protein [Streptomyces sp. NPDC058755]